MHGLIRAMGTQSGKHNLQIGQALPIVGLETKSFRSGVLSAPFYSTDLIDGKCLKVNFLQSSYNLNINSINNNNIIIIIFIYSRYDY